jgi:MerR family mercuric resistance operon transcriptional regulator
MLKDLTIGKVAKASGVGIETVRFYERKGLIEKPKRRGTGAFRAYNPDDPGRIRFIKRAQDLGFTLREIKDILDLNTNPKATCTDMRLKADAKVVEVESKLKDLKRMLKALRELASACGESKQAASACQVMNCFEAGWKC